MPLYDHATSPLYPQLLGVTVALILLPIVIAAALFAAAALATGREFIDRHGIHKIGYRLLTGFHLDGERRHNGGWLRHGTRHHRGDVHTHLGWWTRRSRLHRAIAAWAVLLAIPYTVIGLAVAHGLTIASLKAAAILTALAGLAATGRWIARRGHRRTIRGVATPLAGHIGWSANVVAASLRLHPRPEDARPGEEVVLIKALPDSYAAQAGDRQWVEQLLTSRMPVPLSFRWDTQRHPMRLQALCASAPPPEVPLAEWAPVIATLGPGRYFIGASADNRAEVWDATAEDPHLMIGGRTRRGKTNVKLAIIATGLHRGERFTAIDPKRISLECLRGVPGFTLASDPGNVGYMWEVIADYRAEMDAAIAGHGDGTPHTLVLEEANQLHALFRDYWEAMKDPGQRVTDAPPWVAVRAVLHQGAQFGYRVIVGGQDLKDNVLFGSRYSFGTILMTGFTRAQWAYAVGTVPIPAAPTRKGRFHLVRGPEHKLVQVVVADPRGEAHNEQAWRQFALAGRAPQAEPGHVVWAERVRRAMPSIGWQRPPPAIGRVLIGPAAAAAYLGWSREQFRAARRRHPIEGEFTTRKRGQDWPCWARETLDLWLADVEAQRVVR
jgi:hypothetical protein